MTIDPTTPTSRDGWSETYEQPDLAHLFLNDKTRSECGHGFWTGPRGPVNSNANKCDDCQEVQA